MKTQAVQVPDLVEKLFRRHSYKLCEELLHEHIRANETDIESRMLLSEVYERLGLPDYALQNYRNLLLFAPALPVDVDRVNTEITRLEGMGSRSEDNGDRATWQLPEPQDDGVARVKIARRFSPYFGFPEYPTTEQHSNYGFVVPEGAEGRVLPYVPADPEKEFIVGVFGGSIASGFFQFVSEIIADGLAAHPDLKGRKVVVLNFAMGALKQPQTLIYLAYFASIGQKLDMVVNIDGLNDLAGCTGNLNHGHHMAMPPADITKVFSSLLAVPKLDEEVLTYFLRVLRYDRWIEKLETGSIPFVGALGLTNYLKRKRHLAASAKPDLENQDSMLWIQRVAPVNHTKLDDAEFTKLMENIADFWLRSSRLMLDICRGMGTIYVHSLHPHHSLMKRPLSKADQEMLKSAPGQDQVRRMVALGYPCLLERMDKLTDAWDHAHYCPMLDVLEDINDDILVDAIAHLKPIGLEAMGHRLVEYLSNQKLTLS